MAEQDVNQTEDLSPEDMALLEAMLAEEAGGGETLGGGENIQATPENQLPASPPEQVAPVAQTQDPRIEALIQNLAAQQGSISSMLQTQTLQQEQSNSALQQLLNPQPQINSEEAALQQLVQSSVAPLQQQNEEMRNRIQQMELESQRAKAEAFNAQQISAINATKAKYPDFDPRVAGETMQPFINTLVDMGMDGAVAQQVVMKQFGTEQGLELIWQSKKYMDVLAKSRKQRPDTHVPSSNMAAKPNSIMEQLNSEDEATRNAAINDLWTV